MTVSESRCLLLRILPLGRHRDRLIHRGRLHRRVGVVGETIGNPSPRPDRNLRPMLVRVVPLLVRMMVRYLPVETEIITRTSVIGKAVTDAIPIDGRKSLETIPRSMLLGRSKVIPDVVGIVLRLLLTGPDLTTVPLPLRYRTSRVRLTAPTIVGGILL